VNPAPPSWSLNFYPTPNGAMRVALCAFAPVAVLAGNPIAKVLELLEGMRGKIVAEGEEEQATYEEYTGWCRKESKALKREVADAQAQVKELTATIEKATATIDELTEKTSDLAASITSAQNDLKDATAVREKEHQDYAAVAAELQEAIDTIERGIAVLEREMPKGSFMQLVKKSKAVKEVVMGLSAVVQSTAVDAGDSAQLTALLEDDSQGPESSILEVMGDMLEKAQKQKATADAAELQAAHDFSMMKATLESEMATRKAEKTDAKRELAVNQEEKATAEGDLEMAQKELSEDSKNLADVKSSCEERAHEWDVSMQSRAHEIEGLDKAAEILKETTGGAEKQSGYSFLQVEATVEAPQNVKDVTQHLVALAKRVHDRSIAMLAMRVRTAGSSGGDPFAKVKGLIEGMIGKLEAEAAEEAKAKAFCDKETKKTNAKIEKHKSTVADFSAKVDSAKARVAKLKEQVSILGKELKNIANDQAEATKIRNEQRAEFEEVEADYQNGLEGVGKALKVLRDYFGQSFVQAGQKGDTASSIIGILEVAESDFGRLLAEARETESSAAVEFEQMTEESKLATATKTADVKGKTAEIQRVEHSLSELLDDRDNEQEELDSVLEYLSKLNDQCVAKPEPYEERKRRRDVEMEGLKTALEILEGQAMALLSTGRRLRRVA